MEILIEQAASLRSELQNFVEPFDLSLEQFEDAGVNGILELGDESVEYNDSTFANNLFAEISFLPIEVIRSICLGSAYLLAGLGSYKDNSENAVALLVEAAKHIGFVRGLAHGLVFDDEKTRERLSRSGQKGADARHQKTREFKVWALECAKVMRGADADIARELANKIPAHLVDVSKDHERLIYDTLRAQRRSTRG